MTDNRSDLDLVKSEIESKTLEKYDDAMRSGDQDWLNGFWEDVSESTGYDRDQLINAILDEFNSGEVKKTALDYYMSTLVEWPGRSS